MKKILIALPVIFCIIISCIPFVASAEVNHHWSTVEDCVIEIEEFITEPLKDNYFQLAFKYNNDSDPPDTEVETLFFHTDQIPDVSKNDNLVTFTFQDPVTYYIKAARVDSGIRGGNTLDFTTLVFDTDTNFCSFDGYVFPHDQKYKHNIETIKFDTSLDLLDSTMPDVTVRFLPNLEGDVSREIISNGEKIGLYDSLKFIISNNSNFPIQYTLRIRPVSVQNDPYYDIFGSNDVFMLTKYDNVYDIIAHNSAEEDFNIQDITLYYKPTQFHYVAPHSFEEENIPFSMINLKEGVTYNVQVIATRNDLAYATTNFRDVSFDGFPVDPTCYEIDSGISSICYDKNFTMTKYSDIKYDHSFSSGGILPYQDQNDYRHYSYMYDSKVDKETGEFIVGHKDLYNDPNSWLNKKPSIPSFNVDGDEISSDVFSNSFSQVFGFVSMFLSWLPPSILTIFIFGFSSIVIIAIIKAVK